MNLSNRLTAVSNMISPELNVADVGCDHGYLAIFLTRNGISPHVIATDINRGPLERAREHVNEAGLSDRIDLRLSDGLKELEPGEADCIVMAGMGGPLMIDIMEKGREVCREASEFILQPQSEQEKVRHYLENRGYCITDEDLVFEDGKFYPMIKAVHGRMCLEEEIYYRYGKVLIEKRDPVMLEYLKHDKKQLMEIKEALSVSPETEKVSQRLRDVCHDIKIIDSAIEVYSIIYCVN